MKTLQLVPAMEQGGVERGVTEINRALVARGWENVVVSAGGRLADQVVAKAFGGALDIVRDGIDGVLIKDDGFADAILKVANMKFGDLRSSALERFSFARMVDRTVAVYEELAGRMTD